VQQGLARLPLLSRLGGAVVVAGREQHHVLLTRLVARAARLGARQQLCILRRFERLVVGEALDGRSADLSLALALLGADG
jgi:hypothetical protein